jgi:hypothetical protein
MEIKSFIDQLQKINSGNIVSITRYDTNRILVLLEEINFNNLLQNSTVSRKMQKKGLIPLFMTSEYIDTSSDVYPLEYLKMTINPETLYGKSIVEEIQIPTENIRLESEQKIKGALIRITQVILENGKCRSTLKKIAFRALDEVMTGIQGLLYIKGQKISDEDSILLEKTRETLNTDLTPLIEILNWKNGTKPEDKSKLLYEFYEKIEELAYIADKMEEPST